MTRLYSSIAQPTTLASGISGTDATLTVQDTVGYPTLTTGDTFTAALDAGGASEELVDVTAVAGNVWTVTRGVDGTSAQSHGAGAVVRHSSSGRDFADIQTHIGATTGVHGTTGALVGTTNTQTLSNKTLLSPTITSGALSGTFTGSPELSGALEFTGAPILQGADADTMAAEVRASGDTEPRLNFRADGALVFGPGDADGDATLSRSAAGTLAASGGLETGDDLTVTGTVGVVVENSTDAAVTTKVTDDTSARFAVTGGGKLSWGTGSASRDTFLYRSALNALTTDGDLTVSGDLKAAGIGQSLFAIKTSDTSRANTASPAPDPHLQLQLDANATYLISAMLIYGGSETGDILIDWDGPASTDGWWYAVAPAADVDSPDGPVRFTANRANSAHEYGWDAGSLSIPFGMTISGILQPASAMTYRLLWSQSTANATAMTVYAQSWLRAGRVA
jgi:hypothetical protein